MYQNHISRQFFEKARNLITAGHVIIRNIVTAGQVTKIVLPEHFGISHTAIDVEVHLGSHIALLSSWWTFIASIHDPIVTSSLLNILKLKSRTYLLTKAQKEERLQNKTEREQTRHCYINSRASQINIFKGKKSQNVCNENFLSQHHNRENI